MPVNLKRKVFNSCVLPVLTYGLEAATMSVEQMRRLAVTQRSMERRMIGVTLRDRVRNVEVRKLTKVVDIVERVSRLKWQWAGHIARQENSRWTKRVTLWRPRQSARRRGRPPTRWADDIKSVAGTNWSRVAQDRKTWKYLEEAFVQEWMRRGC